MVIIASLVRGFKGQNVSKQWHLQHKKENLLTPGG